MSRSSDSVSRALEHLAQAAEDRLESHPEASVLEAYRSGALGDEEARALQGHLEVCRECTALFLDLVEMVDNGAGEAADDPRTGAAWAAMERRLRAEDPAGWRPEPPAADRRRRPPARFLSSLWAPSSLRFAYGLAAFLALAVLGLLLATLDLRRSLHRAIEPRFDVAVVDLEPRAAERTEDPDAVVLVRTSAERLLLILQPASTPAHDAYLGRIVDASGHEVWSSRQLVATEFGNFTLELSRRFLPAGRYRIELFGLDGDRREPLGVYEVDLAYH